MHQTSIKFWRINRTSRICFLCSPSYDYLCIPCLFCFYKAHSQIFLYLQEIQFPWQRNIFIVQKYILWNRGQNDIFLADLISGIQNVKELHVPQTKLVSLTTFSVFNLQFCLQLSNFFLNNAKISCQPVNSSCICKFRTLVG